MIIFILLCLGIAFCFGETAEIAGIKPRPIAGQPDDESTRACKKKFPDFEIMQGFNETCRVHCKGKNVTGEGYFAFTVHMIDAIPKDDETPCGAKQHCLGGECFNFVDIQLCRDNHKGPLVAMDMEQGCFVNCIGNHEKVMFTQVARPKGIECSERHWYRDYKGTCDGFGFCNVTSSKEEEEAERNRNRGADRSLSRNPDSDHHRDRNPDSDHHRDRNPDHDRFRYHGLDAAQPHGHAQDDKNKERKREREVRRRDHGHDHEDDDHKDHDDVD